MLILLGAVLGGVGYHTPQLSTTQLTRLAKVSIRVDFFFFFQSVY